MDRDGTLVTITELRIELFRVRIPLEGHDFSHPYRRFVGVHLHSGYWVFPAGKEVGEWCWPTTPASVEVKGRVEL